MGDSLIQSRLRLVFGLLSSTSITTSLCTALQFPPPASSFPGLPTRALPKIPSSWAAAPPVIPVQGSLPCKALLVPFSHAPWLPCYLRTGLPFPVLRTYLNPSPAPSFLSQPWAPATHTALLMCLNSDPLPPPMLSQPWAVPAPIVLLMPHSMNSGASPPQLCRCQSPHPSQLLCMFRVFSWLCNCAVPYRSRLPLSESLSQ